MAKGNRYSNERGATMFCKDTKINSKYCKCKRCTRATFKVGATDGNRLQRRMPVLAKRFDSAMVKANVYVNYEAKGSDGMEIFHRDLSGLPLPVFSRNNAKAKHDDKGNITSPYYAWQATVYIPKGDPVLNEIASVYGNDKIKSQGSMALVHSNELAKTILGMRQLAAVPANNTEEAARIAQIA